MTTDPVTVNCQYCDGQGYVAERDCSGEAQYERTCPLCGGTGQVPSPAETVPQELRPRES